MKEMYEMTEQHIEILERLHQSSIRIEDFDSEWNNCRKVALAQLLGSGYISESDGNLYITIKGTGRRIEYRYNQGSNT